MSTRMQVLLASCVLLGLALIVAGWALLPKASAPVAAEEPAPLPACEGMTRADCHRAAHCFAEVLKRFCECDPDPASECYCGRSSAADYLGCRERRAGDR